MASGHVETPIVPETLTNHPGVELSDDLRHDRYAAAIDGEVVASCFYRRHGTRWFFVHTEVEPSHAGQGIGSALARFALDDVRAQGGSLVPICPFVRGFIERHAEYQDLIDVELWERVKAGWEATS